MPISDKMAYTVLQNEDYGRYVVAARDLTAGEEVLVESAAVVGPKHHTPALCLGCHAIRPALNLCSRCGWPVCGPECEVLPQHRDAECEVFANAGVKFGTLPEDPDADCPQLECITPLRLLLTTGEDRWKNKVGLMESHETERRDSEDWRADQVNIVDFLLKRCNLTGKYSEELVHQVCGILAVNAFEARAHHEFGTTPVRGIYPQLALLAHSCVPNTSHSIGRDFRVRVRTTVPVKKGEQLTTTYTHTLMGTHARREHLKLSKYFECKCSRCSDPSELGANLSTFKCPKCEWGWVLPAEPLNQATDWKCNKCEFVMPNQSVLKVMNVLRNELAMLPEDDLETRESLLKKYRGSLHPRHAHLTEMKHTLAQLYGRADGYTFDELPDILMERKIEMCRHILDIADIVEPGKTRLRGMMLYELHAPMIMLARSQFQQGVLNGHKLLTRMQEAEKALAEAVDILSLEEEDSTEGQLARHGTVALQQLRESLEVLPKQLDLLP